MMVRRALCWVPIYHSMPFWMQRLCWPCAARHVCDDLPLPPPPGKREEAIYDTVNVFETVPTSDRLVQRHASTVIYDKYVPIYESATSKLEQ